VSRGTRKLDELAALLERTGGDPTRIEAVRRAQKFRRSWIDLAEHLVKVRRERLHERWGFPDFHAYCEEELTLKRGTVDKLTISFSTLERHAPHVLQWDGVAKTIPSYQAIDYFARAANEPRDPFAQDAADHGDDAPPSRAAPRRATTELKELASAVFDEGQPVGELRRRFDPTFFPQPRGAEQLATLRRASTLAAKLADLLPALNGVEAATIQRLERELGRLRNEVEELAAPLAEKVERSKARMEKTATAGDGTPRLPPKRGKGGLALASSDD
jgi:hypothetical protein